MNMSLDTKPYAELETDALVSCVFEDCDFATGRLGDIDKSTNGLLATICKSGELTGKPLEMTLIHAPVGLKAARLLLVGAGKREKFTNAALRKIAGAAVRYLKARSVKRIAFLMGESDSPEQSAQTIAEAALTADFETDKYKTDKKTDKSVESLTLVGYAEREVADGEKGLARGRVIAEAQNFTRDLVNEPSN